MDNKLSELSKPTAFVVTGGTLYQDRAFTDKSTAERSKADRHDGAVIEPLYSQEYVSALQARIAELEQVPTIKHMRAVESALISATDRASEWERKAISNFDDCASMSQRIAEMESANKSQDDHINQQQDRIESLEKTNAGLGQRLGAAEKRLATPVRLPRTFWYEHDDLAHEIPVLEKKKVVAAICGAGFTVEGDE
ncbi:hypothetical protein ACTVNB_25410 [Serratia nematodiphila]